MNWLEGLPELARTKGCVLSIGNFDGVHQGHQAIVSVLISHARNLQVPAVVLTFEPHPAALLNPGAQPPRLTTAAQKASLLTQLGVDAVLQYPTDWNLLNLSAREFFDEIVIGRLNAIGLVEGPNFFFGKGRTGNGEILRQYCQETGRFVEILAPSMQNGALVSSSQIRALLTRGDIEGANQILGRRYEISGRVVHGDHRGRTIGFPTANIDHVQTLIPGDGVYGGVAMIENTAYVAAVNIGPNPTFADGKRKIEAHLLQFSGDLYGKEFVLQFQTRIRNLQKFNSTEELQAQIKSDVTTISNRVVTD